LWLEEAEIQAASKAIWWTASGFWSKPRAGIGRDSLWPDRDRVGRPDLRRCPGAAVTRARRDPRGPERARREL